MVFRSVARMYSNRRRATIGLWRSGVMQTRNEIFGAASCESGLVRLSILVFASNDAGIVWIIKPSDVLVKKRTGILHTNNLLVTLKRVASKNSMHATVRVIRLWRNLSTKVYAWRCFVWSQKAKKTWFQTLTARLFVSISDLVGQWTSWLRALTIEHGLITTEFLYRRREELDSFTSGGTDLDDCSSDSSLLLLCEDRPLLPCTDNSSDRNQLSVAAAD